jgi:hypothetical protein
MAILFSVKSYVESVGSSYAVHVGGLCSSTLIRHVTPVVTRRRNGSPRPADTELATGPRQPTSRVHPHFPLEHVVPEAHVLPQPPQFWLLVLRLAQTPLQSVVPAGHAHEPPLQTRLPEQICPQKPQSFFSVCRSTQLLPQRARPLPQLTTH